MLELSLVATLSGFDLTATFGRATWATSSQVDRTRGLVGSLPCLILTSLVWQGDVGDIQSSGEDEVPCLIAPPLSDPDLPFLWQSDVGDVQSRGKDEVPSDCDLA